MKKLILALVLITGIVGGCICSNTNPDPHRYEDITGEDDTEDWW